MKIIFNFTLAISFLIIIYSFTGSSFPKTHVLSKTYFTPPVITSDSFIIGATDNGWEANYTKLNDTLKFNTWHKYSDGTGWIPIGIPSDSLFADQSAYTTPVSNKISSNYSNNLITVMERWKISHLAYSQRSDYQCEIDIEDDDYWFYTYNTHGTGNMMDSVDNSPYGNGEHVRYCYPDPNQTDGGSSWVVKDLKSNREQVNQNTHLSMRDTGRSWYAVPRIRIDKNYANVAGNFNKEVCRVEALNFNGDPIHTVILRVSNFKNLPNSTYNGEYFETQENFFNLDPDSNFIIPNGTYFNTSEGAVINLNCAVDFRVWYYGNCKMWIDRIRVETDIAHDLMSNNPSNPNYIAFNNWLQWECGIVNSNPGKIQEFYIEEIEFNTLPAIKYVNHKIDSLTSGNHSLMVNINYDLINIHKPDAAWNSSFYYEKNFTATQLKKFLSDYAELKTILTCSYALEGHSVSGWPQRASYHPPTLSSADYSIANGILSNKSTTVSGYEDRLQGRLDTNWRDGTSFSYTMKVMDTLSKISGMKMINMPQAHLHYSPGHLLKEVSNEELDMLVNLALTYGSKGILYFAYMGFGAIEETPSAYYIRGLINSLNNPRYENVYGQLKWAKVKEINTRLQKLGHYFMSFNDIDRRSAIYRLENERNLMLDSSYFSDVITYLPVTYEPPNDRYIQVATFTNSEPNTKYFMIANRRCAPYTGTDNGGRRKISVVFDESSSAFSKFNNWKIIDLEDNSTVATFDKNISDTIELNSVSDWFMPGEGRLYKIAPVMQEGGTFVTDEEFGNVNITCKGAVNNDGFDLTIGQGTNINFHDTAKIVMEGGEFECGYASIGSPSTEDVNLKGKAGVNWEGLEFNNCALIKMINTNIDKIESNGTTSNSAITAVDCPVVLINKSHFDIQNTGQNYSAIDISFVTEFSEEVEPSIDFMGNTFEVTGTKEPQIKIMNYSFNQAPVYIRWNNFVGDQISNGVLLNNVTGGVISKNIFTDFEYSVTGVATYIDIFNNTNNNVSSSSTNSTLSLYAGTYANMTRAFGTYMAGYNTFNNYGGGSNNVLTDNAYFNINLGYNVFNVSDGNMHFSGTFYDPYSGGRDEFATENCFKVDGDGSNALHDVIWEVSQDPVSFIFEAYNCDIPPIWDYTPITVTQYIEDTLWFDFGGLGGGSSNKITQNKIVTTSSFKDRDDSLKLNLRKRNLEDVKRIGNEILDNYADSIRSMDVIQPLYYSTMRTDDTSNSGIIALKTKLENLITNHSSNASLVLRCNYFIQKCKVILGQYQSALTGFYDIMQNYPYSWEGVVAGWDYAATQLISQGGSGGGESSLSANRAELSYEPNGDDPKGVKKTVENTLSETKEKAINQIKIEEQQIKELRSETKAIKDAKHTKDINHTKSLEKKLQQKKVMSEVIKPRKPETVIEHIKFVNSDIQKIYSVNDKTTGIEDNNSIPEKYSLSQNYPNPFNPVTKIKFEIPKESKVTIVIYDILGRKVAQLVNNELRVAGRYEVQFNGQNFASGVYFYRLVANDFIDTKRMVLIK